MTAPRPHVHSLIFEVTSRCNHACRHCYNVWQGETPAQETPYPRGELDTVRTLDLLAKALDESECTHVTLTGGEPLLRPDLPDLVAFLRSRGVRTTVISNGRLLDAARIQTLLEAGVGLFELPLLSSRPELHDRLSGAPGAWAAVLKAMAELRLQHGQVVAAFVATRPNIEDLEATLRLAFAFGARAVMFNRFNPGGRGRIALEALLPDLDQVRRALGTAEAAAVELGLPVACSIPLQPCLFDLQRYPHLSFGFCAAGTGRAYYALDPLGNLRPCNHSNRVLGNLFDEPFAALVAPDRLGDFIRAVPAFCLDCSRRAECQGGCKAAAQVCAGSLSAEEPFLHANRGQALKESLEPVGAMPQGNLI
jgi:pyrroloquinoline quinone biosynthesis protein E